MKLVLPRISDRKKLLLPICFTLTLACLWEAGAYFVANPKLLPGIGYIALNSFPEIALFSGRANKSATVAAGTILIHTFYTLLRICVGVVSGILFGVLAGLAIHYFKRGQRANAIILSVVRAIPLFALIPLFLHWFGGQELGIYLYITFSVFVVIATGTYEAVFGIPSDYLNQAVILGANKYQVYKTVILFAIQPQMIGSLRNIIGLCWAFSLGAEYLSARSGIGYLLYQSYLYSDMGKLIVFAWLYVIYGTLSFFLTKRALVSLRKWDYT